MLLNELLRDVEFHATSVSLDVPVSGIGLDTRQLTQGDVYVARRGLSVDGHDFIEQAIDRGASALVVEEPPQERIQVSGIPWVCVSDANAAMATMASNYCGRPTEHMNVVGITGTNGKTSTAFLVEHALNANHLSCGLMGTVVQRWPGVSEAANMTTPDAIQLQETAQRMRGDGVDNMVLEVSSHAIEQRRVDAVDFTVAAFTNLSQDHLDYHGTMDAYASVKERLFTELLPASRSGKGAVINVDDPIGCRYSERSPLPVLCYGLKANKELSLTVEELESDLSGTRGVLKSDWGNMPFSTPLVGQHNTLNLLAAFGCGLMLDRPLEEMVSALESFEQIPGRMNRFTYDGLSVFVDYAHTEDALSHVLKALRTLGPRRVITVFGCGGDRDASKRGPMGQAAVEGSDVVVLTSDNPRFESPESIANDVVAGWGQPTAYDGKTGFLIELNRGEAIRAAIDLATEGDVILIAGKGHENVQEIGGTKIPFDDRAVVSQVLASRKARRGNS